MERTIKVTWNDQTAEVAYETDALGKAFAELAGGARPTGGCRDDLSDTTPTWIDITAYFLGRSRPGSRFRR